MLIIALRTLSLVVAAPMWLGFLGWIWLTDDSPADAIYYAALLTAVAISWLCARPWISDLRP